MSLPVMIVILVAFIGLAVFAVRRPKGGKQCPACGAYCSHDAGTCKHCGFVFS